MRVIAPIPAAACALLLALALAARPANGQERQGGEPPLSLTRLTLEELGNLPVVSVAKAPGEVWNTAAAVFVLTAEDIRRSGATSVPEALRLVPGVQVSRIDTTHWAVGIRGVASQFSKALLVLVDGRSVYTPLFAGVYWDVQDLFLEDIERIEIIRGPGGTIWGANAVQGVINIITKDARDTTGLVATAGGGDVELARAGVRYGAPLGDRAAWRLYGHAFRRGPQAHVDHGDFDRWSFGRAGLRLDGERRPGETWSVQAAAYTGEAGERVAIGFYDPPAQLDIDGMDDVSGGHVLARWRRSGDDGRSLQVQGYYDLTTRRAPHYGETRHTFDIDVVQRTPFGSRHTLTTGAGARHSPSHITQKVPTLTFTDLEPTDHVYSFFVQDEIAVRPDSVTVTAGAKIEHQTAAGVEVQPSLRAIWRPNRQHAVWAALTRAVRTPAHLDRTLELTGMLQADPPIFLRIAGTATLEPERSVGAEIGYRQLITPALSLDMTVFRTSYDGLLSFGAAAVTAEAMPIPHVQLAFPWVNGMMGSAAGVEIAPAWQPTAAWQLRGGYSFLQMQLENTPESQDETSVLTTEESSPRHQLFAHSVLSAGTRWELVQTYRYVGALPAQAAPAFHALDLRVGWRPRPEVELALAGHNLLDDTHVEFDHPAGSPPVAIRRSLTASIRWRP